MFLPSNVHPHQIIVEDGSSSALPSSNLLVQVTNHVTPTGQILVRTHNILIMYPESNQAMQQTFFKHWCEHVWYDGAMYRTPIRSIVVPTSSNWLPKLSAVLTLSGTYIVLMEQCHFCKIPAFHENFIKNKHFLSFRTITLFVVLWR